MTRIALGLAFAAGFTAAAAAADLPRGAYLGPAPYSAFSWAGPYIGLNLGYQWGNVTSSGADPNGISGGGQVGYLWQVDRFVYGAEADVQGSGANDTAGAFKFSNPWFGTVRGRAGFAMNNILFYGTGGLAVGGGRVETAALSESHTHIGWTVGAGLEVGLTQQWTARAEYLFVDLSSQHYALTVLDHQFQSNLLRFGFNLKL